MGRRRERFEDLAEQYTTVGGVLVVAFALVPMLWGDFGWSGELSRARLALPTAAVGVLVVNALQALRERRAGRRGLE